ncbi:MAG: AzlD domain-containing protein [Acidimicrobiales bacterium]
MTPVSWWTVLIIAAGSYGFKAAGWFGLGRVLAGPRTKQIAGLLPPALLFGLVVTQTFVTNPNMLVVDERAVGVAVGAVVALKNGPFWLVVLVAGATTAVLRTVA